MFAIVRSPRPAKTAPPAWPRLLQRLLGCFGPRKGGPLDPFAPLGLHETTDWLRVRNVFQNPATMSVYFCLDTLNYISAVACYFQAGTPGLRPTCTLANVMVTVLRIDAQLVLPLLAGEPRAAQLAGRLLSDDDAARLLCPPGNATGAAMLAEFNHMVGVAEYDHVMSFLYGLYPASTLSVKRTLLGLYPG